MKQKPLQKRTMMFRLCACLFLTASLLAGCGPKKETQEATTEKTQTDETLPKESEDADASVPEEPTNTESDPKETDPDNPDAGGDQFIDLSITSFAATAQDKAFGKSEQFYLNHPITIRLSAQAAEPITEPLTMGIFLVQKKSGQDQSLENTVSCFLGTMTFALFPKANEDINLVKKFTIPEECLLGLDGKKQDKATFNLAIDPYISQRGEDFGKDTQAGLIIFGKDWAEEGVAECKNVDPGKVTFGCVEEFSIERPKESNKLDYVIDDFTVNSPVMVLVDRAKHPDAQAEEQFSPDISISLSYQMRGAPSSKRVGHDPVTLHYEVCAYKINDCDKPQAWWPLSVYERKTGSPNNSVSTIVIKDSAPNADEFRSHGLFAVGETLKNIKATQDYRYILRATINRGDQQNKAIGELPTHALGEANDNNFLEKKILIVIPNNAPKETPKLPKQYSFSRKITETDGNTKILGIERKFTTEHKLSTWGLSSETKIKSELKGWIQNENYFRAGYSAIAAPGATVPAYGFNAEVVFLDVALWEKNLGNKELSWKPEEGEEIEWDKTWEKKKRYWVKFLPVDIVLAFTLKIGIDDLEVTLENNLEEGSNQPYPKGVLALKVKAEPAAAAELSLAGFVSIVRYRGGIKATLTLVRVSLPAEVVISSTKYPNNSIRAKGTVEVKGKISTLNGNVALVVEKRPLKWKKKWFIRVPYFGDWEDWKTVTLFEWEGKSWETTFLQRAKVFDIGTVPEPKYPVGHICFGASECLSGLSCEDFLKNGTKYCAKKCTQTSDCGSGNTCHSGQCYPACKVDKDCENSTGLQKCMNASYCTKKPE